MAYAIVREKRKPNASTRVKEAGVSPLPPASLYAACGIITMAGGWFVTRPVPRHCYTAKIRRKRSPPAGYSEGLKRGVGEKSLVIATGVKNYREFLSATDKIGNIAITGQLESKG